MAEGELYISLTEALVEDVVRTSSAPIIASLFELECHIRVFTFERDQARVLIQTALAGRDAAFTERDAAISDHDAHWAYANEVIGQAWHVLEGQDRTVRMAMTLLDRINAAKHRFRSIPQTLEVLGYLDFLASLTSDL